MPCKKGTKQLSLETREEIIRKHEEGNTTNELAAQYGKTYDTIRSIIKSENKKKRLHVAGIVLKKKGRPTKNCIVTENDKIADLRYKLNRKDTRIKQLEMENELLRDFLKEAGRS